MNGTINALQDLQVALLNHSVDWTDRKEVRATALNLIKRLPVEHRAAWTRAINGV